MAFVLVIAGILMVVTGAKGTYAQFGSQVAGDFTGDHNFTYWLVAIGAVGSVGYIEALRGFSRMFMALILIAMVLSNKGFFAKFTDALKSGPVAPDAIAGSAGATTVEQQQSNLAGEAPATAGQGKFNGWMNYLFGTGGK